MPADSSNCVAKRGISDYGGSEASQKRPAKCNSGKTKRRGPHETGRAADKGKRCVRRKGDGKILRLCHENKRR